MTTDFSATNTVADICPAERRSLRKLASALCLALNIQSGTGLVMILGQGDENDNQEALETWVAEQLNQLGMPPNRDALPTLLQHLETALGG